MTTGEFVALLATVTLPVKLPVVEGEKLTCNVAFWPGARIRPAETPLVANLAPATLTPETFTLEFPAFFSVTSRMLLAPMATFPKLKLEALESRSVVAAAPVPLTAIVLGELEALLITDTIPEMLFLTVGENMTLNVDCLPGPMVTGRDVPVILKPLTAVLTCVTVISELPLLDTRTD